VESHPSHQHEVDEREDDPVSNHEIENVHVTLPWEIFTSSP
jgi:hypothetical protein